MTLDKNLNLKKTKFGDGGGGGRELAARGWLGASVSAASRRRSDKKVSRYSLCIIIHKIQGF